MCIRDRFVPGFLEGVYDFGYDFRLGVEPRRGDDGGIAPVFDVGNTDERLSKIEMETVCV